MYLYAPGLSNRRKAVIRRKIAAAIIGLIALAAFGGTLNYMAYSAHICATVPNHYTCIGE